MPEGPGAPPSPRAARSAPDRGPSEPALCPQPRTLAPGSLGLPGSPGSPGPRWGAPGGVPQKLAEARSSQYGLNVFVAGLLLLLAWAVHAAGVGKSLLLGALTALMLLQLLWMLWSVGRAARRRARPKDTHAGARWLRGECGRGLQPGHSVLSPCLLLFLVSVFCASFLALPACPPCPPALSFLGEASAARTGCVLCWIHCKRNGTTEP